MPIIHIIRSAALFALTVASGVASAQTTAAGPYYATPAWDQTMACSAPTSCPRFIVLTNMNSKAVLDRETGLVWARDSYDTTGGSQSGPWDLAAHNCYNGDWGTGRKGWRLPSAPELTSLLVPSAAASTSFGMPAGHPFAMLALPSSFWTDTLVDGGRARVVFMPTGTLGSASTTAAHGYWCVRSGR